MTAAMQTWMAGAERVAAVRRMLLTGNTRLPVMRVSLQRAGEDVCEVVARPAIGGHLCVMLERVDGRAVVESWDDVRDMRDA